MNNQKNTYVCPAGLAGSLDNSFRKWLQNPQKILKPCINKGMTVLDLGCGPGVFTVEIAKLLHESGKLKVPFWSKELKYINVRTIASGLLKKWILFWLSGWFMKYLIMKDFLKN